MFWTTLLSVLILTASTGTALGAALGLTGLIISATIKLQKLPLRTMEKRIFSVESLVDTQKKMIKISKRWDYLISWNDLSTSRSSGCGYILAGRFAKKDSKIAMNSRYLALDPSRKKLRFKLIREFSIPLINKLYAFNLKLRGNQDCHFWNYVFPQAHIGHYFDMYGQKGFFEHQVLIPHGAWEEYSHRFRLLQKKFSVPILISSLKLFSGKRKFLNFSGNGVSFTMNLLNNKKTLDFLNKVDELDCKTKSIANVAKDSRLRSSIVQKQYSEYNKFKKNIRSWSTDNIYESSLSRRLAI